MNLALLRQPCISEPLLQLHSELLLPLLCILPPQRCNVMSNFLTSIAT
jgi:hypothetical protein